MALGTALAIGSAVSGIAGGIGGLLASGDERAKASQALQAAQDQINSLQLPPDQARPIIIQKLKSAGVWKPEMEQHIDAGISKMSQVQEDPALRQKQMATLNALQGIADTGLTATGRAEFNKARAQAQQDAEAKRQQLMQSMQARGQAGSGTELAAALSASQGGAQSEAEAADRIASEQEAARMSALGQLGQMAGSVRSQDFSNEAAKAQAADAFKMFDVQNQVAQQQRNTAATNQAAQYDVMNQQALSNQNVSNANSELYRQRQGEQQNFQNAAALAGMKANSANQQAQTHTQNAQGIAQGWSNIGQGVAAGLGGINNYMNAEKTAQMQKAAADQTQTNLDRDFQFKKTQAEQQQSNWQQMMKRLYPDNKNVAIGPMQADGSPISARS